MLTFEVQDMTCGHCVSAITNAVKSMDAAARVEIDLARQRAQVEAKATASEVAQAIQEAGYTPVELAAAPQVDAPKGSPRKCCCN